MKLGTRLLVVLLPTIAIPILGYAAWALWDREHALLPEAQRETQAYAATVGEAFDKALGGVRHESAQGLADQITRAPSPYAIVVYDSTGQRSLASDAVPSPPGAAPPELREVLRTGRTVSLARLTQNERVYSVIRPIRDRQGQVIAPLEVAQPLSLAEAATARVRRRFAWITVAFLAAVRARSGAQFVA